MYKKIIILIDLIGSLSVLMIMFLTKGLFLKQLKKKIL